VPEPFRLDNYFFISFILLYLFKGGREVTGLAIYHISSIFLFLRFNPKFKLKKTALDLPLFTFVCVCAFSTLYSMFSQSRGLVYFTTLCIHLLNFQLLLKMNNDNFQEKFFDLLREHEVYEMGDDNYENMTSDRKQEHARKWVSVLNQLGFCFAYESSEKPVIITNAGKSLINNPEIEDEVFLRQLLKYQKPCALPKQNGASVEDVSVLPFIVSLKTTYELQGLSKEEISIFLNTTVRMSDVDKYILHQA